MLWEKRLERRLYSGFGLYRYASVAAKIGRAMYSDSSVLRFEKEPSGLLICWEN